MHRLSFSATPSSPSSSPINRGKCEATKESSERQSEHKGVVQSSLHSADQHSTAQHNTAQRSTASLPSYTISHPNSRRRSNAGLFLAHLDLKLPWQHQIRFYKVQRGIDLEPHKSWATQVQGACNGPGRPKELVKPQYMAWPRKLLGAMGLIEAHLLRSKVWGKVRDATRDPVSPQQWLTSSPQARPGKGSCHRQLSPWVPTGMTPPFPIEKQIHHPV